MTLLQLFNTTSWTAGAGFQPFGLRDVKIVNSAGTQADLPAGQLLRFSERVRTQEMMAEDGSVLVDTWADAVEWELEAGGISLEAYALLTGRTTSSSGTTPSRTYTLAGAKNEAFGWVRIYGKAMGADGDDIHCKLWKCKLTSALQGSFNEGKFFVTNCKGLAVDDGTNGIWTFVQNETAAGLPAS